MLSYVNNLIAFANDVDNMVNMLDSRMNKQNMSSECEDLTYYFPNINFLITHSTTEKGISRGLTRRNSCKMQDECSKLVRSLRRLYLCMSDLFEMLGNCADITDSTKKRIAFNQIKASIVLIRVFFLNIEYSLIIYRIL